MSNKSEMESAMNDLLAAIPPFTDDDECRLDHHGFCQTHFTGTQPCAMVKLRAAIARAESLSLSPKPEAAKAVACGEPEQEMEWRCEYCNVKYAEYINGCPKCFMGEAGTASSVRLVPVPSDAGERSDGGAR